MDKHIKEELAKIDIPAELHTRSQKGILQAKAEMGGKVKRFTKKRVMTVILAACLIIPSGAFAYEKLLADELYGSFEQLKKRAFNITMQSYLLFNAKLTGAKDELGEEEFARFKELLKVITTANLDYGNENGNIDYTAIPAERLEEIRQALSEVQPVFDRLNGDPSSKEVLTEEEYAQYIEALMQYQTVLAKLGVTNISDATNVPADLQEQFDWAQQYLDYVYDKQKE